MNILFFIFFIWLILEGALRKWVFTGYSTQIFFVKYLILGLIYLTVISKIQVNKKYYPYFGLLILYVLWCLFEIFNSKGSENIQVNIVGVIVHLFFIPLIFIIPIFFNNIARINKFLWLVVYISIPIFILGVVQHFSPVTSEINKYVYDDYSKISYVGERARITGVFSYISTYASFLGFSIIFTFYLILTQKLTKFRLIILYVAAGLGIINFTMTGSRGPFVYLLIGLTFIGFYIFNSRVKINKLVFVRGIVVTVVLSIILMFTQTGKSGFNVLEKRFIESGDTKERLIETFSPFKYLDESGLLGYGIGTTYQGSNTLVSDWKDMPRDFEEQWERILLELGIVGLFLVIALRIYIFFFSYMIFRRLKTFQLKLIALIIFLLQIPIVFGLSNQIFNYMENLKYWFLIGLLVSIYKIDKYNEAKNINFTPRSTTFTPVGLRSS